MISGVLSHVQDEGSDMMSKLSGLCVELETAERMAREAVEMASYRWHWPSLLAGAAFGTAITEIVFALVA